MCATCKARACPKEVSRLPEKQEMQAEQDPHSFIFALQHSKLDKFNIYTWLKSLASFSLSLSLYHRTSLYIVHPYYKCLIVVHALLALYCQLSK